MRALRALLVLVLCGYASAIHAQKSPLQIEDLYRFDAPKSAVLFPDGKRAAYIRQWIDAATKQERNSLWIVNGDKDKARPMEADQPDARFPVVSPDGKWIVFQSTRPRPQGWKQVPPAPPASDPATDLWMIAADGGAALPLAGPKKDHGRVFGDPFYCRVAFSPDGKKLVFVADDGADPRTPEEIANDVEIVRPDQGEGYTGYGPSQVWIADLDDAPKEFAARSIRRLTNDDVWYGDPQWSPDGKTIVVHANKAKERESVRFSINRNFDIWAIDVATGKQTQLTTGPGPEVSPRWSPDGQRLACLSVPRKGSHRDVFNLMFITLGEGGPHTDILFDHHGPKAAHPPQPAPAFPLPATCWQNDRSVWFNSEIGVAPVLGLVALDVKTGRNVSQ
jgi:Tol biopolymer transport system component